jgi:hypothetical protein
MINRSDYHSEIVDLFNLDTDHALEIQIISYICMLVHQANESLCFRIVSGSEIIFYRIMHNFDRGILTHARKNVSP